MTEPKYFLQRDDRVIVATEEQEAIIELAKTSRVNILINALAGAAKTSTLEFLAKYMPLEPMLCIAFNKRIAEEMAKRLPGHVKCATINSIGHRIWASAIAHKIVLDKDKIYKIVKDIADNSNFTRRERGEFYEVFGEVRKLIGKARREGYIPNGVYEHVTRIVNPDEFWEEIAAEDEDTLWVRKFVDQALSTCIQQAYRGLIDFDDQIYMPTLFGGTFPQFPVVMVDEAQDLSALNHAFLRKLARARLIAVGDPWQSIYGFRGAVASGMARLAEDFSMTEMTLSVSFRCPIKIVENARFRAPHMKWADGAAEGSITRLETWDAKSIPDNSAIICRNNAPLFSLAFKLLRRGRGVKLVGFDIGPALVKTLKKLGPEILTQKETLNAIDIWESEKLAKAKDRQQSIIRDKAECLRVFAGFGSTLGEAAVFAEHIFSASGTIQLLSGHKSKGLEWEVVYHLDPHRIPSPYCRSDEDHEQERNVRYVIETRAKRDLYFVTMEGFEANERG